LSVEYIEHEGRRTAVTVPIDEHERLVEAAEMLADVRAYDEAKARGDELFPAALLDRLLADESRVRVFREHRGLTQQALADACGISKPYLSQIEAGRRRPSTGVLTKLATALAVEIDDLV
jgi:DNA-binding XRE family transcriptional regulator